MEEARRNVVNSINLIARQMNLDRGAGAEDLVANLPAVPEGSRVFSTPSLRRGRQGRQVGL